MRTSLGLRRTVADGGGGGKSARHLVATKKHIPTFAVPIKAGPVTSVSFSLCGFPGFANRFGHVQVVAGSDQPNFGTELGDPRSATEEI